MGATWKTKSMFDLDFKDNFCSILNSNGIETFTFDIPETSHQNVVDICNDVIKENNITNIMGYSYGCLPAIDLSLELGIDNLILLDPFTPVKLNKTESNNRFYYNKSDIKTTLDLYTSIPENIKDIHLNTLPMMFDVSNFPNEYSKNNFEYYSSWKTHTSLKCKTLVAFTKSSNPEIHKQFSTLNCKFYDASHWILLEEGRKPLAVDVKNMLKIPCL